MSAKRSDDLTLEQLDGRACIHCGGMSGPMAPVDPTRWGMLFTHALCADGHRDAKAAA